MSTLTRSERSEKTAKIVFAKGVFDVFLSLSLIFAPSLVYDGPITRMISGYTKLPNPNWKQDTQSAYGLASLIMGAAFAGIKAGLSNSDDAYQAIATLNGVFAVTGLMGCYFAPNLLGSSFLLLASMQDVLWFSAIVTTGGYGVLDTLGLGDSSDTMVAKTHETIVKAQEKAGKGQQKAKELTEKAQRKVKETGGKMREKEDVMEDTEPVTGKSYAQATKENKMPGSVN